jgi:hypothetical protein
MQFVYASLYDRPNPLLRADGSLALLRFQCGRCYETHSDETDAQDCCAPEVRAIYQCPECALDYDARDAAVACCPAEGDRHGITRPAPLQLEAAGQQRIF